MVDPSSSAWWQIPHHWGLTPYRVEFAHVIPRSSQLLVSLRSSFCGPHDIVLGRGCLAVRRHLELGSLVLGAELDVFQLGDHALH